MPHPVEAILEDETITEGLPDSEAGELISWLVGLADEAEGEDQEFVEHLKRLGRQLARISARWGVPITDLINLVEIAWEEPGESASSSPRPMRA